MSSCLNISCKNNNLIEYYRVSLQKTSKDNLPAFHIKVFIPV